MQDSAHIPSDQSCLLSQHNTCSFCTSGVAGVCLNKTLLSGGGMVSSSPTQAIWTKIRSPRVQAFSSKNYGDTRMGPEPGHILKSIREHSTAGYDVLWVLDCMRFSFHVPVWVRGDRLVPRASVFKAYPTVHWPWESLHGKAKEILWSEKFMKH